MQKDLGNYRKSYEKSSLTEGVISDNPMELFQKWFYEVEASDGVDEPNAMTVSTIGLDGFPKNRVVLLKKYTFEGFIFYTNYESAKGQDIAENPNTEALFFWHKLERQIRISGSIAKIDADKSAAYFQKRPHDSQVGAWVSQPQSGEVANREVMEQTFEQLKTDYPEGAAVPTPEFWGGYEITVNEIEFWQGRANRMHDRIVYHKEADGSFSTKRLLP